MEVFLISIDDRFSEYIKDFPQTSTETRILHQHIGPQKFENTLNKELKWLIDTKMSTDFEKVKNKPILLSRVMSLI